MPRYPYSTRYAPPAAVLPLQVGRPGEPPVVLLPALIDTGADTSVLPAGLAAQLNLTRIGRAAITGFAGHPRALSVYAAEIRVGGHRSIIEAVSYGDEALIGRDLLNRMVTRLDGPHGVVGIDET